MNSFFISVLMMLMSNAGAQELIVDSKFVDHTCENISKEEPPFHVIKSSDPIKAPWYEDLRAGPSQSSRNLGKLAIGTVVLAGQSSVNKVGTRG